MFLFPSAAAVVALVFAWLLLRRYAQRRRPAELAWAVALLMYAAASAALALGQIDGWSNREYEVYWTLGAVLNVPYLALGEVYLLNPKRRRVGDALTLVVLFATGFALNAVRRATLDPTALLKDLPLGKDVFRSDALPYRLAQIFAYPAYVFLIGGCVWSLVKMRGNPALRDRFAGTLWIAVGATIVAIGSGVGAGLNVVPVFSVGLLAGIAMMFWGFLRATRPVPVPAPPENARTETTPSG